MIKLFFIFLFVLLLPIAYAIYGGESYTQLFQYCDDNITILINGSKIIDIDEFTINDNCSILERGVYNNTYICNCSNNWLFNLTTKINTINNYNVIFNFNFTEVPVVTIPPSTQSTSGGSGGGIPPTCIAWSKCVNNKTIRLCQKGNSFYNQTKSCVSNTTSTETKVINLINVTTPTQEQQVVVENTPQTTQAEIPPELTSTGINLTTIIILIIIVIVVLVFTGVTIYYWVKD